MSRSPVKSYWHLSRNSGGRIVLYALAKPKQGLSELMTLHQAKAWARKRYGPGKHKWIVFPLSQFGMDLANIL